MIAKAAALGSFCLLLAACAAPAPVPPPPAPPPPVAAAPAPPPPAAESHLVNPRRLTCGNLMSADDDDRAAASMFLLGYEDAVTGRRIVDIDRIEALEKFALEECSDYPNMPASQAFAHALRSRTLSH